MVKWSATAASAVWINIFFRNRHSKNVASPISTFRIKQNVCKIKGKSNYNFISFSKHKSTFAMESNITSRTIIILHRLMDRVFHLLHSLLKIETFLFYSLQTQCNCCAFRLYYTHIVYIMETFETESRLIISQ